VIHGPSDPLETPNEQRIPSPQDLEGRNWIPNGREQHETVGSNTKRLGATERAQWIPRGWEPTKERWIPEGASVTATAPRHPSRERSGYCRARRSPPLLRRLPGIDLYSALPGVPPRAQISQDSTRGSGQLLERLTKDSHSEYKNRNGKKVGGTGVAARSREIYEEGNLRGSTVRAEG
jgi:hypothetical protein